MTCTGVERLDVVQASHWKLAEMTGEAKRNTRFLLIGYVMCVYAFEIEKGIIIISDFIQNCVNQPITFISLQPLW